MRGELNIQSLEKKCTPEAERNRAAVQAFLNDPSTKVQPIVRSKRTEDEKTDLKVAKANFRLKNGMAWDNQHAKKKAQRKAAQELTNTEAMKTR